MAKIEIVDVLSLPMGPNDANAKTIRDYLKSLLTQLWVEEEGFSGKRPFGNSGWQYDVYAALIKGNAANGRLDSEGCVEECDRIACDQIIQQAIASL